jgi:hypothetical protein
MVPAKNEGAPVGSHRESTRLQSRVGLVTRLAFTGPTDLTSEERVALACEFRLLPVPEEVTTGGAPGLDMLAAETLCYLYPYICHRIVYPVSPYARQEVGDLAARFPSLVLVEAPSGKEPYRDRNERMLDFADELIAVLRSDTFYRSGEWMTVNIAKRRGIPVAIYNLATGEWTYPPSAPLLPPRAQRANELYEQLRLLEKPELETRHGGGPGIGKQAMIADIIERELAGGEI